MFIRLNFDLINDISSYLDLIQQFWCLLISKHYSNPKFLEISNTLNSKNVFINKISKRLLKIINREFLLKTPFMQIIQKDVHHIPDINMRIYHKYPIQWGIVNNKFSYISLRLKDTESKKYIIDQV